MNQLESTKTIIVKDFNHARKLSIEKWTVIRDLIAEAFNAGTVKCGFCDLARQRDNLSGCSNCFPHIDEYCQEMLTEWADLEDKTQNLILKTLDFLLEVKETAD